MQSEVDGELRKRKSPRIGPPLDLLLGELLFISPSVMAQS
jgi:hypothetical protein